VLDILARPDALKTPYAFSSKKQNVMFDRDILELDAEVLAMPA
jgi:hypothetical protein